MKPGDNIVFNGESSHVEEFTDPGDVIVELQAADEESSFVREGSLLKASVTISLGQSLCGSKVVFKDHPGYPNGIVLDIPIAIQNKSVLVFNDLGMPTDNGFGELQVTVTIKLLTGELEVLKNNLSYFQGLFVLPEVAAEGMTPFNAQRFH